MKTAAMVTVPVRLTAAQQRSMQGVFQAQLLAGSEVWLFGSRTDLTARGGDIDLLIVLPQVENDPLALVRRLRIALQRQLGERKIDIVLKAANLAHSTLHEIAQEEGVLLWTKASDD